MTEKDGFNVANSIIMLAFALLASLGGALTVQSKLTSYAAWVPFVYAASAGIFIALTLVIFTLILSALDKK